MVHATFPKEIQAYLESLPPLCGLLCSHAGMLKILIKVTDEVEFPTGRLGHRSIWEETRAGAQPLLHLTLVFSTLEKGLIPLDCHLNPEALGDTRQALIDLARAEWIDVYAVNENLSPLGRKQIPWPISRREELLKIAGLSLSREENSGQQTKHEAEALPVAPSHVISPALSVTDPVKHDPSLLKLYRQAQKKLHHLNYLSAQFQDRAAHVPGYEHLKEQHLVRFLHIAEDLVSERAKIISLASPLASRFALLLEKKIQPSIFWPTNSLWIEGAFPGSSHPRNGILIVSTHDSQIQEQPRRLPGGRLPLPLSLDYGAKIIDEFGYELLRFHTRYLFGERPYWGVAPSHQCPYAKCQRVASNLPHALSPTAPLALCPSCEREAAFWRKALIPLLSILQKPKPEKRPRPLPPPTSSGAPQEQKKSTAPPKPAEEKPPISRREKRSASLPPATNPLPSVRPFDKKSLPCMVGIPWQEGDPDPEKRAEQVLLVLLKVPTRLPVERCFIGYGSLKSKKYPNVGGVIALPLLLRFGTQTWTIACLASPASPLDHRWLSQLSSPSAGELRLLFISDDPNQEKLGTKTVPWERAQQQQLLDLLRLHTPLGFADAAKVRFLSEHPPIRPHLLPEEVLPDAPSPPHFWVPNTQLPDALLERYATLLLQSALQEGKKEPQLVGLSRALECSVRESAESTLFHQLAALPHSLFHHKLPLPASHCWITFERPLPREGGEEVAGLWINKQKEEVELREVWVCRLIGKQASRLPPVYCYTPKGKVLWSFHEEHQCWGEQCHLEENGWKACPGCLQEQEHWVNLLQVLFRLLRGDYATSVHKEVQTTTGLVWNNLSWEEVLRTRNHWVVTDVDVDQREVHANTAHPIMRESWLALLRQRRPELVEKDRVQTVPHTRHLASGKEVHIDPYELTVYRRRDKKRKRRMRSSSLE